MLPVATATTLIIPTRNRPHGLQKSRRKNRRSQKSSVWMMKRLNRTGAPPHPGSPMGGAVVSRRNGLSRNGPAIPTVNNGAGFGSGCCDAREFRIVSHIFLRRYFQEIFFHGIFLTWDSFFTGKKNRRIMWKKTGCDCEISPHLHTP